VEGDGGEDMVEVGEEGRREGGKEGGRGGRDRGPAALTSVRNHARVKCSFSSKSKRLLISEARENEPI